MQWYLDTQVCYLLPLMSLSHSVPITYLLYPNSDYQGIYKLK